MMQILYPPIPKAWIGVKIIWNVLPDEDGIEPPKFPPLIAFRAMRLAIKKSLIDRGLTINPLTIKIVKITEMAYDCYGMSIKSKEIK